MDIIWKSLLNTPWWVYLVFIYVLKVGYDATKERVISLHRLFILPTLFTAFSIYNFLTYFRPSAITVITYLLAFLIGIVIGWVLVRSVDLKFDKKQGLVRLPGTFTTLFLVLLIFFAKYYLGYSLAIDPTLATDTTFELLMLSISGICTGIFIGRLACYLWRKHRAGHFELNSKH